MAIVQNPIRNGKDFPMDAVFDLDAQALKELEIQRSDMECPPFNTPPRKLQAACEGIVAGKVAYNRLTARWQVEGSKGTLYEVTKDGCSCPNGVNGTKTRFNCWHAVAVEVYDRWRKALTPALPKETPMPVHTPPRDDEYTPEPVALTPEVLPAPLPTPTALVPAPPLALAAQDLEASLAAWSDQRKVLTRFIKQHLVEGSDYGKIHVKKDCKDKYRCDNPYHFSKDCLFKAGSEKFLGLLRLKPTFRKDDETWEMLGRPPGVICLVCTLLTLSGDVLGEGRGIRDVQKESGDYNRAIKMASKSAQLDAILRTGCLSDVFTQDLDSDEQDLERLPPLGIRDPMDAPPDTAPARTIAQLKDEITSLLRRLGLTPTTRQEYETEVFARTGVRLARENYAEIVDRLRVLLAEA